MIRRFCPVLLLCVVLATPLLAQDAGDPLEAMAEADRLCAEDPAGLACAVATDRSAALIATAVAEAGNTRDRGMFIDEVRLLLADTSPQVRTSAAYALAKFAPDAADTAAILTLLRDPVSNVRAGGWAAAWMSSDPAARLVVRRAPERPGRAGYGPDPLAFDPAALGLDLPDGAAFLWLAADQRTSGQLDFLTDATPEAVLAHFASTARGPARPVVDLLTADPATGALVAGYLDPAVYGAPQGLALAPAGDLPLRLVVVYRDLAFGQTGFAVIFADGRSLAPPPLPVDAAADLVLPLQGAALGAALLRVAGVRPDAPAEETDLFLSVTGAYGFGADGYLELYPGGAYAAEMRAILAGPGLILDAVSYSDTGTITASFRNLPPGSSARIEILDPAQDYAEVDWQALPDAVSGQARFDIAGRLAPGVYLMRAEIQPGDGSDPLSLARDFSVTAGLAELAIDKTDFAPGEPITVRFSGMSGDAQDYIATATAGSPNASYTAFVYTNGLRDGSVTLPAPAAAGTYELRAFFREDESLLRGSQRFTVSGTTAPPVVPTPGAADPAPEARASLTLNKTSYAPGEAIVITYADMFGDRRDYVATVAAGAPLNSYLLYAYTAGATAGSVTLVAPSDPGAYEVRAFFKEDETILRASAPFVVE